MHDRFNTRRDPRRGADSLGTAAGTLLAAGAFVTATGGRNPGALVAGVLTLLTGLVLLALAADAWDRSASRSGPLPRTAVRWTTAQRPIETTALVPLAIGSNGGRARRRVVSLPYAELPPAHR